jgi:hypothetical protein
MATVLQIGQLKAGLFKLTNSLTGADLPVTFSNIVFKSSNVRVFGLQTDPAPSTMDIPIIGPGSALLTISADCTFPSPQTGQLVTRNKSKSLSISVSGSAPGWIVTLN